MPSLLFAKEKRTYFASDTEYNKLPERDFEHELEKQQSKRELTLLQPQKKKTSDFESDTNKAAKEGKLTSVQYLV